MSSNFNSAGKPILPINHENNYGFKVGGPFFIPKVYDGRKKTFFLFTSDWFRQNQAFTGIGIVPTTAEKGGDFSNFLDAQGNLIPSAILP